MRIFVISLVGSVDHRDNIIKSMSDLSLDFEFFDAVDCRNCIPTEYEKMIDRQKTITTNGYELSNGEYGCSLSHTMLYKKIIDENIQSAIILEDDVIIDNDFAELVKTNYLDNCKNDGVFLYHLLASVVIPFSKPVFGNYYLHKLAKTPFSTAGYYLNNKLAHKLYNKSFPIYTHADWACDLASFNVGAIVPRIVQHPSLEKSTLVKSRTAKKMFFGKYGFGAWLKYKFLKPFSKKVSITVEGK